MAISYKFPSILSKSQLKPDDEKGSQWITTLMWQSLNGFFGIITHDSFFEFS